MKILFITDNFPPEVNAPATRTYEHCVEWVKAGCEVTVITCAPNFPQGKVYEGYKNKLYQKETMNGIKVIRVWSYISSNKGFIRRIMDYMSFAFMSFWAGLFKDTDVIIATSPQFFTTWSGSMLSFFKRKPWVFELRDLWPASILAVGAMDDGKVYRLLKKIELTLYKNADLIVPLTEAFKRRLIHRGISAEKQLVVTNGANLDLFQPTQQYNGIKKELGLTDKFIVGYIGTHGMAHALDFILDCAADLREENFHFLLIGDGAEKQNLIDQARDNGLKNVTFHDPVPKNEVPGYISIIDVSLIPLKKSDVFKTVIPSKIFENSAMGKPILLGVEGQAREIIEEYQAGLCFEPENKQDFIQKLTRMREDQDLYNQIVSNQKRLVTDYDRKKLAKRMLDRLKILVKGPKLK